MNGVCEVKTEDTKQQHVSTACDRLGEMLEGRSVKV